MKEQRTFKSMKIDSPKPIDQAAETSASKNPVTLFPKQEAESKVKQELTLLRGLHQFASTTFGKSLNTRSNESDIKEESGGLGDVIAKLRT